MRAMTVAIVAALVVVGARVSLTEDDGLPFIAVAQGLSIYDLKGAHVFVDRAGEVVTAFSAASGQRGARVQWCPREQLWWAPSTNDLFSASGKRVFGEVGHDLIRFKTTLTAEGLLDVDVAHPIVRPPTNGRAEVDRALYEFYQRYLNYDAGVPTTTRPVWCPNPRT